MRISLLLLFLIVSPTVWAQTQAEMNRQAYSAYQEIDKKLNDVYQQILVKYKLDTAFTQNLKVSQRIWIQFRDAELKAKFPERESGVYGSIHPTCRAFYLKELTEERINRLQIWIEGSEEVDICAGSVIKK
ncbi:lysozyme inhibitor LprI family protein [Tunicatimonas pelagia]|uniref:lysozyme inhibitor LprI family protein n=1 Tax=Tunicatimonas pelagia TaxID=931531 RepID=UPI002665E48F|nr:lysozyme inhibitor LprI family protein [Tunicatimonas pelagia]WKN40608.1 DUF1311 domain-containing protein [Tunicatimonas pelagia]